MTENDKTLQSSRIKTINRRPTSLSVLWPLGDVKEPTHLSQIRHGVPGVVVWPCFTVGWCFA